jgi:hypothetical protein
MEFLNKGGNELERVVLFDVGWLILPTNTATPGKLLVSKLPDYPVKATERKKLGLCNSFQLYSAVKKLITSMLVHNMFPKHL